MFRLQINAINVITKVINDIDQKRGVRASNKLNTQLL